MRVDLPEADRTDVYWRVLIPALARVWRNLIVSGTVAPKAHSDLLDRIDAELGFLSDSASGVAASAASDAAGERPKAGRGAGTGCDATLRRGRRQPPGSRRFT